MSTTEEALLQEFDKKPFFSRLTTLDWVWAACVALLTGYSFATYSQYLDVFDRAILLGTGVMLALMGWMWKPLKLYILAVACISAAGIALYGNDLALGESNFFLKYLLASQSAVMWMNALFVLAMATYFLGLFSQSDFINNVASKLTWIAAVMGMAGLLVRWRESYLIHPDVGHIPVSNLYEVFILFCLITALIYLYYEAQYENRNLGGFATFVISAAVCFLLWYSVDRGADEIQPLVPALQSYWMKLHVPTNFIGYGSFALSAMVGVAYLLTERSAQKATPGLFARVMPSLNILDDIMYKANALGFAFFTIATILGAVWAAEAWGSYWSWDPKETWALIVWLNYAAWLHLRLSSGWRGRPLAWWSILGLFITLFAFIGVNMFLSGLHSYGEL